MELKDQIAIVTGAGRGIGEAIALTFAREGADIVVNDIDLHDARKVSQKIVSMGRRAVPIKADVTSKSQVESMVKEAVKEFGTIDILVNNAGVSGSSRLVKDIPEASWDQVTCEALDAFARALADFDPDQAKQYRAEVERYRADIRRAVERSIALTPVRRLRNGTYRSYAPGASYFRSDLNGRHYGAGDLLHMQTIAAFDWRADDPRLAGALETQEDAFLFLRKTWTLSVERQKKGLDAQEDWFWGGIANALGWYFLTDAHLVRDDVPAFPRGWVNNYAAFVAPTPNGEYHFSEGFPGAGKMDSGGGYPNSNSTAGFIRNFRNLLVMEEYCGEQGHIEQGRLWLARATPRAARSTQEP